MSRLSAAELEGVAALLAECADYMPREEWRAFLRAFLALKEYKKAPPTGAEDPSAANRKTITPLL